ncbi:hypothetical protein GBW32_06810 [Streptomyces tsukubensis]|nr:hypothetical protein GBW32_06810 [Streptomyces tsukubensis]
MLLGAAVAVAGSGAALALAGADTPLRGPLTLFFLVAAPGGAVLHALRGLDPWGRVVASLAAALAVNMLVAQAMLALRLWSVPGGVVAVGVVSCLILLPSVVGLPRGRMTRGQDS